MSELPVQELACWLRRDWSAIPTAPARSVGAKNARSHLARAPCGSDTIYRRIWKACCTLRYGCAMRTLSIKWAP